MSEIKVNKISPRTNCGTVTVGDSGDSVSVTSGVPVTVNGDLKSNALKATDGGVIISQSGTTITIGASGDTINLASGASQSGFGRTGTVDWQTGSIKTANFSATSGEGYFCNTAGGEFAVSLPAGSAGAIVSVQDYNNTFDSNGLKVEPNGSEKINGGAGRITLDTEGEGATFVYIDSTVGWRSIHQSAFADVGDNSEYVAATGGTITTCGNYKIHKFTGNGTFTVTAAGNACGSNTVDYLVVAGGGGGAGFGTYSFPRGAGAGGGGGVRASATTYTNSGPSSPRTPTSGPTAVAGLPVSAQAYPITVGGGGAAGPSGGPGNPPAPAGGTSTFSTITSAGGAGGSPHCGTSFNGIAGGSGSSGANTAVGGAGNTPPVSPPQGMPAGDGGGSNNNFAGGGGGGFMVAGTPGNPTGKGGCGGAGGGFPTAITAAAGQSSGGQYYFGGGGAGGWGNAGPSAPANDGGLGGGGNGGSGGGASSGTANTGGAGGGNGGAPGPLTGASGGSGIVLIRYQFQAS